jgi:hypothetical protein
LPLVCVYVQPLPPGVYRAKVKFGIEKLGTVCVHPYPNMLVVVCCGILKVGAKSSMMVRLWKWFINWADVLCIVASLVDAPLVCGLVCAKLTT